MRFLEFNYLLPLFKSSPPHLTTSINLNKHLYRVCGTDFVLDRSLPLRNIQHWHLLYNHLKTPSTFASPLSEPSLHGTKRKGPLQVHRIRVAGFLELRLHSKQHALRKQWPRALSTMASQAQISALLSVLHPCLCDGAAHSQQHSCFSTALSLADSCLCPAHSDCQQQECK